jgi:leucyl aminopeptidase
VGRALPLWRDGCAANGWLGAGHCCGRNAVSWHFPLALDPNFSRARGLVEIVGSLVFGKTITEEAFASFFSLQQSPLQNVLPAREIEMEIKIKHGKADAEKCDVLALFIGEPNGAMKSVGEESRHLSAIRRLYELHDFRGGAEETAWLYPAGGNAKRVLLIGLGEEMKVDVETLQQAVGRAVQAARKSGANSLCLSVDYLPAIGLGINRRIQLLVEALLLANYQFTKYKSPKEVKEKLLRGATILIGDQKSLIPAQDGARWGEIAAKWTCFARDLQNTPANDLTPELLAKISREKARSVGLACRVFDHRGIARLKMGALLGVGQGSTNAPRFVELEHKPARRQSSALVFIGKGITFDTGGISIKSSDGLDSMKFDMSGAAAVLAATCALAELGIPLHVVGLLPCAENMPGGHAQRPGDVVRACNGKTIEVADTDAEGRLVLADALAYAPRFKPAATIDLATLTGAVQVALGGTAAGLFGSDAKLLSRIKKAAEATGERVWELPLYKEFFDDMKSEVADIRNISTKSSGGGASKGAAFLATFAEGYPWAHLDIAGVAFPKEDRPLAPKGGSGWGVRLLVQFCRDWIEQGEQT